MTSTTTHPDIHVTPAGKAPSRQALPGLPRMALSPAQQLAALERIGQQAEQRIKLGARLFKAAHAQAMGHRQMLDELKAAGESHRDALAQEVAGSLRTFDQWIGQMEQNQDEAIYTLQARLDAMESRWDADRQRIERMIARCERLLEQTCQTLASAPAVMQAQPPAAQASPPVTPPTNPTRPVRDTPIDYTAMLQRLKHPAPAPASPPASPSGDR